MPNEEHVHQPHDKLFKAGFREPANAAAFLEAQFSPELNSGIDWERLTLEDGSFIDSQFRLSESDLLFSVPVDAGTAFVYMLFEHQSSPDPWVALRLLRYMTRIWERERREHPTRAWLPAILPVVLSQNASHWDIPERFRDLVRRPVGATSYVPDFTFCHRQLADMPFDKIPGRPGGILVLRALKAQTLNQLLSDYVWDEELANQDLQMFRMILRYITNSGDVDLTEFHAKIERLEKPTTRDQAMTIAQQLIEQGREEARKTAQQVILDSMRESILLTIQVRFGEISDPLRSAILAMDDVDGLKAHHRRCLQAKSVGDCFPGTHQSAETS